VSFDEHQIKAAIDNISNLPTIPKTGMRIIKLAADPEVSIAELSIAIQQDPSLALRLLKVANSPFYGASRRIDSLQLAIVILGLKEVQNIILGITFFNILKNLKPEISRHREEFWFHCAACGMVARILCQKIGFKCSGTDFIVGLLHDVGKIVIEVCFGGKFVPVFDRTFTDKPSIMDAESEILGHTHEKFGGLLAERWNLPKTLCDAIAYHHALPSLASFDHLRDPRIVALAFISEAFCERYEIGWDGDFDGADLRNESAWNTLLGPQHTYTPHDIDNLITETLQIFKQARPRLLWE
jgi:HD-like signal output (HDOD) protein